MSPGCRSSSFAGPGAPFTYAALLEGGRIFSTPGSFAGHRQPAGSRPRKSPRSPGAAVRR